MEQKEKKIYYDPIGLLMSKLGSFNSIIFLLAFFGCLLIGAGYNYFYHWYTKDFSITLGIFLIFYSGFKYGSLQKQSSKKVPTNLHTKQRCDSTKLKGIKD